MNTEKLISLKENFTGQKFQWIKPENPQLLGKVVKCRDIDPMSNGRFIAIFDDGSKVDTAGLNSQLLMIHGDMKPLTIDEVKSIYGVKPPPLTQKTVPPVARPVSEPISSHAAPAQPQAQAQPQAPAQVPFVAKPNMFSMFNSEDSQISISLNVKLPDRKLLKLMYTSAEDKDKFLSELAEYLFSMINKTVVKDSVQSILAPPTVKKEIQAGINLKEVK